MFRAEAERKNCRACRSKSIFCVRWCRFHFVTVIPSATAFGVELKHIIKSEHGTCLAKIRAVCSCKYWRLPPSIRSSSISLRVSEWVCAYFLLMLIKYTESTLVGYGYWMEQVPHKRITTWTRLCNKGFYELFTSPRSKDNGCAIQWWRSLTLFFIRELLALDSLWFSLLERRRRQHQHQRHFRQPDSMCVRWQKPLLVCNKASLTDPFMVSALKF